MDNQILIIQVFDRKIIIHTKDNVHEGSLINQLDRILNQFGFIKTDQNKFAFMERAVRFDPEANRIYFDEDEIISCPVSRRNQRKINNYFDSKRQ